MGREARKVGAFSEARLCFDRYLRAFGIPIDSEISVVNMTLGRTGETSRAEMQANLAKLLGAMSPADATSLVMLVSNLDRPDEPAPPSEAWATGTSEQGESAATGEILDLSPLPDTGEPNTGEAATDSWGSPESETSGRGSSEDET